MAPKSLVVLAAALLVVIVAAGQVPRGAALGASTNINSSVLVSGVVPCAAGNNINAATAPVFPNAGVQLVCGSTVVATTTADGNGVFFFSLPNDVDRNLLTDGFLGNKCKVVVITPLVACDKSLAAVTGTLTAPLKILGIVTGSGSDLGGLGGLIGGIIGLIGQIIGGIVNLSTQSFSVV